MKKIIIALVFLTSCRSEIYTKEECKNFKKGDTIYIKRLTYALEKCVVLKNNPEMEVIELKNLTYSKETNILLYENFRFK